jgi:hypothetical protein
MNMLWTTWIIPKNVKKPVGDHKYPQVMAMWKKLVNNWCDRLDPFPRRMVKLVHLAMWCWNTVNKSSNYQPNNGISCSDTTKENQEKLGASECGRFIRLSSEDLCVLSLESLLTPICRAISEGKASGHLLALSCLEVFEDESPLGLECDLMVLSLTTILAG